ncbi:hypothetical protein [Bradyrhizobium sp. 30]|uniref:hypothetical protein n=1 Tax=Bradyrhizobium sp. 30 TaxID=2782669 RepID=UPI001FF8D90A|nr:hypothetical protein [Bradyrhizobium sp. 30]MCK1290936.1 dihydroxyacetone kinase subunit DhaK [Bradyrhizobium sp. 30]
MMKLMNSPDALVDVMLAGLVAAQPSLVREGRVVGRAGGAKKGKVGIVSGGGSGHLPPVHRLCRVDMIDAVTIALGACKTRDEAAEAAQNAARETLATFRDRPNKLGRTGCSASVPSASMIPACSPFSVC